MRSTGVRTLFGIMTLLIIVGVMIGYRGIAKIKVAGWPPFSDGMLYFTPGEIMPVPDSVILAWDSTIGKLIIALGCLFGLGYSNFLLIAKERPWLASGVVTITGLAFGGVGLWIYIHSAINVHPLL